MICVKARIRVPEERDEAGRFAVAGKSPLENPQVSIYARSGEYWAGGKEAPSMTYDQTCHFRRKLCKQSKLCQESGRGNWPGECTQDLEHYSKALSVDAVQVKEIGREPIKQYMPQHPLADDQGYVYKAPVNVDEEMVDMLEASRQYQNNVEVISTLRALTMRTINIGK